MPVPIGLQLYSVRDACERDFLGTLERVAEMGYDGVVPGGLEGHAPEQVRAALDRLGLRCFAGHEGLEALLDDPRGLAEQALTLGHDRIVMPWTTARTPEETEDLVASLLRIADALAEHGVRLGYHNHDFEFAPWPAPRGAHACMWDRITAEQRLFLEPDLGWVWYAGRDPIEVMDALRGRTPVVHVKDFASRPQDGPVPGDQRALFCPVGDGRVGFDRVVPRILDGYGVEAIILEQDHSLDRPTLEAAERSLQNARPWVA